MSKFIFSIIGFLLLYTSPLEAQPQPIELRILQGYYANEKLKLDDGVNYIVFSKERDFERYFGHIEKEDQPNFDFEYVIVMLTKPTKEQYFLSFKPAGMKAGDFIEVYCSVKYDKHELTYYDHPIAIAAIPKYFAVTKINFYNDDEKKRELLKAVKVRVR